MLLMTCPTMAFPVPLTLTVVFSPATYLLGHFRLQTAELCHAGP